MRQPFRTRQATRRTLVALALALLPAAVTAPAASADEPVHRPWYFDAMKVEEMWKVSLGEGVTVAVIDVGINELPELKGQLRPAKRFTPALKSKGFDHGTDMAALIAGTGADSGMRGLAPGTKILPVDIKARTEAEVYGYLPKAIDYAVDNGARIINMSIATPNEHLIPKRTQAAVNRAHGKGVLMFASSGNGGTEAFVENYPATMPGVVRVAATDEKGEQASFSTSGTDIDLAAPGTNITFFDKDRTPHTADGGTSTASALTCAAAALIWADNPDWTHNQVLRTLIDTADHPKNPPNERIGHGTIRPHKVLLEDRGDPGDPDEHPTAAQHFARLDPKADASDNSTLLIAGGLTTALLLATAVTLHTHRRRNRNRNRAITTTGD